VDAGSRIKLQPTKQVAGDHWYNATVTRLALEYYFLADFEKT
jgi:hypothetical protein